MRHFATKSLLIVVFSAFVADAVETGDQTSFASDIRPVLMEYCGDCHDAESENRAKFMSAASDEEMLAARSSWRNVATQLLNRTMPPADEAQPDEADRLRIARWIETKLRETACDGDEYAGVVTTRRLNRREYANTIRDLVGVELDFATTLPVDSGGGEGFDNNGETLFLPPLLLEHYLEAAQQIVDAAIIPSPSSRLYVPKDFLPEREAPGKSRVIPAGERVTVLVPIYVSGTYRIPVGIVPLDEGDLNVTVEVDDIAASKMTFRRYGQKGVANQEEARLRLTRGLHSISIRAPAEHDVTIFRIRVERIPEPTIPVQVARHIRLLGVRPGHQPTNPRRLAKTTIRKFGRDAFRRPLQDAELKKFMELYDSAATRGDSYEDRIKLVMKAILISPKFLFRIEAPPSGDNIEPLSSFELATRLSYLMWSTTPDDQLGTLAELDRLNEDAILDAQVDLMLGDPRADQFFETFVGQWWGTRDVGGRRAATENSIQDKYTPFIAADMRKQAVLLFEHIVQEDRSVLELLDSDYTFLTGKLATFYGMEDIELPPKNEFQLVQLPDRRRGGILGLGAVLALTSHISERQTSPVLRGAWVLDTLLGTRIPAPPEDVPAINNKRRKAKKQTLREALESHREDPSCAACHNLMDPIGFGLENFDFLGRWREEDNGKPIDSIGVMPSGAKFAGPAQLKEILLERREEFCRQLIRKLLGYSLGRSLVDADECTIEQLLQHLENNGYRGRSLLKAVVRSTPFRNRSVTRP